MIRDAGAPGTPLLVADARPGDQGAVRCPHFGPCGGCSFLDRPYAEELAFKEDAFRRVAAARLDLAGVELRPALGASEPLFYRTSLKVPFDLRRGRPIAGFYRRGTHQIVDLNTCAIQHPLLTRLLVSAREAVTELGVSVYDERSHQGLVRHFLARVGTGTGEALAGFVVRYDHDRDTRRLAELLFERFRAHGLVGIVENVNRERGSRVVGRELHPLLGHDTLRETSDGLSFSTSLTTFTQVNPAQASVLYSEVARLLGPLEGLRVADLYSGYGPIALRLARAGAVVHAIEHDARAVAEGQRAAEENGLAARVTYVAGDAEQHLRRLAPGSLDAVVVDPPRRGLTSALFERLCELRVARLVVVSCYPDTLFRDLVQLGRVYALRELGSVDLFPRTPHLEGLALLEPR
jgi:23S rRNA (uracil1939-C5)-methyltransferase